MLFWYSTQSFLKMSRSVYFTSKLFFFLAVREATLRWQWTPKRSRPGPNRLSDSSGVRTKIVSQAWNLSILEAINPTNGQEATSLRTHHPNQVSCSNSSFLILTFWEMLKFTPMRIHAKEWNIIVFLNNWVRAGCLWQLSLCCHFVNIWHIIGWKFLNEVKNEWTLFSMVKKS